MSEATISDQKILDISTFSNSQKFAIFSFAEHLRNQSNNILTKEEEVWVEEGLSDVREGRVLTMKDVFHEPEFASIL